MLKTSQGSQAFVRVLSFASIVLIILLIAFESLLPLVDASSYLNQAGLQRTRSDVLALAMLTLEYRPASEHAQAISNLQVTLPIFKSEQDLLQANGNNSSDEQLLLQQMKGDYLAIVAASQSVIDNPSKPVDPTQVNIIMAHKDGYRSTMNLLQTVLIHHVENLTWTLFYIECGIGLLILGIVVGLWRMLERGNNKRADSTT